MKLRISNECYNPDSHRVTSDAVAGFIFNGCMVATADIKLLPEYVQGLFDGKYAHARFPWKNTSTPPEERTVNFTASDIAPLIGCCPYGGAKDVYRKKLGMGKRVQSYAADRGIRLEPEALRVYSVATGHTLVKEPLGYVRSAATGPGMVLGATIDGVTDRGIVVEIKVSC